jgi:hypothetical protein
MRRGAWLLLMASVIFLLAGLLMPSNREFFEPLIRLLTDLANRRGPSFYEPSQYPGYIAFVFMLSGISLVFSAFAGIFAKTMKAGKPDEGT